MYVHVSNNESHTVSIPESSITTTDLETSTTPVTEDASNNRNNTTLDDDNGTLICVHIINIINVSYILWIQDYRAIIYCQTLHGCKKFWSHPQMVKLAYSNQLFVVQTITFNDFKRIFVVYTLYLAFSE